MHTDFWLERWHKNRIGFHRGTINPHLLKHFEECVGKAVSRILVPLSGKSIDSLWLRHRTEAQIVTCEFVPEAVQAFHRENAVSFRLHEEGPFKVYCGDRITTYNGDFFALPERLARRTDLFEVIYDRAALIALPPKLRSDYVEILKNFLTPGGSILLISLEYDAKEMDGPPFSVPESEIRQMFAPHKVQLLDRIDILEESDNFRERGLTGLSEVVYRIDKPT